MTFPNPIHLRSLPLALCLAGASMCHGAVTYVDPPDIDIPADFGGAYLDIHNGTPSTAAPGAPVIETDSYTLSFGQPSGSWDVNFFFGGAGIAHSSTFQPYRADASDNFSAVHDLGLNTQIDGGPATPEPAAGPSNPLLSATQGGSGTGTGGGGGITTSGIHMGTGDNQFTSGTSGYLGFVLDPGTASEQFGWIEVTLNDDGNVGTIHRWAYSSDPILVGVPEPGVAMLGGLGAFLLLLRRRR